jgi:hypothetical protein
MIAESLTSNPGIREQNRPMTSSVDGRDRTTAEIQDDRPAPINTVLGAGPCPLTEVERPCLFGDPSTDWGTGSMAAISALRQSSTERRSSSPLTHLRHAIHKLITRVANAAQCMRY